MNLEREERFIGKEALIAEKGRGPARRLVKVLLSGERLASPTEEPWTALDESGNEIGEIRVAAWSPAMEGNLGLALISSKDAGADFNAESKDGQSYRATHLSYFGDR
jgi:aminomethyltransferase